MSPQTPSHRVRTKTTMGTETPRADEGPVVGATSPSHAVVSASPALASPSRRVRRKSATDGASLGAPPEVPVVADRSVFPPLASPTRRVRMKSTASSASPAAVPEVSGGADARVPLPERSSEMAEPAACSDVSVGGAGKGGKGRGRGHGAGRSGRGGQGGAGGALEEQAPPLRRSVRVAAQQGRLTDVAGAGAHAPATVSRRGAASGSAGGGW